MSWEPRHERQYKDGVLIHHKVQHTPDGPWEDYVPEEPPPVKKPQPKAFPNLVGQLGMDLRDYFAAKAMQGMLANRGVIYRANADEDDYNGAKRAYKIADAMMKAREEK